MNKWWCYLPQSAKEEMQVIQITVEKINVINQLES